MLIDTSIHEQMYVEDCEVCCNPIEINVNCQNDEIISFLPNNLEQQAEIRRTTWLKEGKFLHDCCSPKKIGIYKGFEYVAIVLTPYQTNLLL